MRARARETVIVLDLLEKLFAGGEHWIQGAYEEYAGSYCLVGGLRQIRRFREPEDKAGMYLLRAIARTTGARRSLIDFNDGTNGSREHTPISVSSSGAHGSSQSRMRKGRHDARRLP